MGLFRGGQLSSHLKDINSDYWKAYDLSLITAGGGHKTCGSVTGTFQQIIQGKIPKGDLAICHIPGIYIVNH